MRIRKTRRRDRLSVIRVVMIVIALHVLVIGGLIVMEALFHLDPAPAVSSEDTMIIHNYLHQISPPPPVRVRLCSAIRKAVRTMQHAPEFTQTPSNSEHMPVTIALLVVSPKGIILGTEPNGFYVYDRETRTWHSNDNDDAAAAPTVESNEDATGNDPAPQPPAVAVPRRFARAMTDSTGGCR